MSVTADEEWDERAKLKQLILDAAMSDNAYTLDDLPALFGLAEKSYMIKISDQETCGCRAAYPFKRRGKTRFEPEF